MSEKYGEDQPWHLTQETNAEPSYEELIDRIEELEKELEYWRGDSAAGWDKCEEYRNKLAKAVEALEKLARLGNGDRYGNSDGNTIARTTLAELKGDPDA